MDENDKKMWRAVLAVGLWFAQAAYILFPFDLLPDFIPVIGWLDDLVALIGLGATTIWVVKMVRDAIPPQLTTVERRVVTDVTYEPIPDDVIRAM